MTARDEARAALAKLEEHPWIEDRTCSWLKVDRRDAVAIRDALRALLDEPKPPVKWQYGVMPPEGFPKREVIVYSPGFQDRLVEHQGWTRWRRTMPVPVGPWEPVSAQEDS